MSSVPILKNYVEGQIVFTWHSMTSLWRNHHFIGRFLTCGSEVIQPFNDLYINIKVVRVNTDFN